MSLIYVPKGNAREYSPLALNIYKSCSHKCLYCFCPEYSYTPPQNFFCLGVPKKDILNKLEKELKKNTPKEQVLLSFISDLYTEVQ
jgi:DNA repair photolyase